MATVIITSGRHKGEYHPLGHRTNVISRTENVPIKALDRTGEFG